MTVPLNRFLVLAAAALTLLAVILATAYAVYAQNGDYSCAAGEAVIEPDNNPGLVSDLHHSPGGHPPLLCRRLHNKNVSDGDWGGGGMSNKTVTPVFRYSRDSPGSGMPWISVLS